MQNNNLIQPTNTIAVEIHRGSSIPSKNTFMLKLLLLTDKTIIDYYIEKIFL